MLTCEQLQTVFSLSQRSDELPVDGARSTIAPRSVSPRWRILTPETVPNEVSAFQTIGATFMLSAMERSHVRQSAIPRDI